MSNGHGTFLCQMAQACRKRWPTVRAPIPSAERQREHGATRCRARHGRPALGHAPRVPRHAHASRHVAGTLLAHCDAIAARQHARDARRPSCVLLQRLAAYGLRPAGTMPAHTPHATSPPSHAAHRPTECDTVPAAYQLPIGCQASWPTIAMRTNDPPQGSGRSLTPQSTLMAP